MSASAIAIGHPLPFSVRSRSGIVLLKAGTMITSETQLKVIERLQLQCDADEADAATLPPSPVSMPESAIRSPMDLIGRTLDELETALLATLVAASGALAQLATVEADIQRICTEAPDAALAAVHIPRRLKSGAPHGIVRAYQSGVLTALLAERFAEIDADAKRSLIIAAVTANIGMLEFQNALYYLDVPLTDRQREQVKVHPLRSTRVLASAGVTDEVILDAVADHHERVDGRGYPVGKEREELGLGAQILGLADRYGSLVAGRHYRPGLSANMALQSLYGAEKDEFDQELVVALVKVVGIYPPGSAVQLANGELGIVARRQDDGAEPLVKSVYSANEQRFSTLVTRDTRVPEHRIVEVADPSLIEDCDPHDVWG